MLGLDNIFASFVDQLSQRHLPQGGLVSLHSRRIFRRLRSIEAAQGCLTAPCSPVASAFGESCRGQQTDLISRDECRLQIQRWHNALRVDEVNAQGQIQVADLGGHGLSSSQSPQNDPIILSGHSSTARTDSASSSPLSSPMTISSASSLPPSSPQAGSPAFGKTQGHGLDNTAVSSSSAGSGDGNHFPILEDRATCSASTKPADNFRATLDPSELCYSPPRSNGLATSSTALAEDSDSATAVTSSPQRRVSKRRSILQGATDHPSAIRPLAEYSTCQNPNVAWSGRRKRARSNSNRDIHAPQGHSAQAQDADPEPTGEPEKKARKSHKSSSIRDRAAPRPLLELVDQIGQTDKIVNIEEVRKLKARPYQLSYPAESLHSRTRIQTDVPLSDIIHAIPQVTREIEVTSLNEHLSRIRNRLALADFYCAYRAAHARPKDFLQELEQHAPQHMNHPRAQSRTRRGRIKESFIELVFCQSVDEREWKKDSIRVNNWQKAGRPWFELIQRFGTGILLLVTEDVTNRRQVTPQA